MIQHSSSMDLVRLLVLLAVGGVFLAVWAGSVAWVWRDANRRGQPGFIVAVLVALMCWPLSLIVWLLARPQPGFTPATGAPRARGWLWALVAVVAVALLLILPILLGILLPAVAKAREAARRTACTNNQKQIALAYLMYAEHHNGACPKTFDDLREYGSVDRLLYCPSAKAKSRPSYELVCGTNATDVIVREAPGNHRGLSVAAYRDGHVEWSLSQGGNP